MGQEETIRRTLRFQTVFSRLRRSIVGMAGPEREVSRGEYLALSEIAHCAAASETEDQGVPVSALVARGGSAPAVSRLLRTLAQKGLIERSPSKQDRRRVDVRIAPRGREVLAQTRGHFTAALERVVERMGEQDADRLLSLLEEFCAAAETIQETEKEIHQTGERKGL